jgi:hypothetical protein
MFEILKGHVAGSLVPPSRRAPSAAIDENIDAVIGCCLEKDPARRFAGADELCDALDQCVGDRAFLRDAHRLPGIQESGLDLSEAGVAARRRTAAHSGTAADSGTAAASDTAAFERGFSEVEGEREDVDLSDLDLEERPDRRRRGRVSRDTTRIPRPNTGLRTMLVVLLLAGGVGGVAWLVHNAGAAKSDRAPIASPTPAPPAAPPTASAATSSATATLPAPSTATSGQTSAAGALKPPAAAQPAPAAGLGKAAPKTALPAERAPVSAPAAALAKAGDRGEDRSSPDKPRGGSRGRPVPLPMPVAIPQWPLPAAAEAPAAAEVPAATEAPVAAEAPSPPPAPPAPAADPDTLLREAQQAWGRRHYALAIDKARAVLEASPGRREAYQIIAICSCAIGATADAQEAVSHLDAKKHQLVQSLCKNNGITIE